MPAAEEKMPWEREMAIQRDDVTSHADHDAGHSMEKRLSEARRQEGLTMTLSPNVRHRQT